MKRRMKVKPTFFNSGCSNLLFLNILFLYLCCVLSHKGESSVSKKNVLSPNLLTHFFVDT